MKTLNSAILTALVLVSGTAFSASSQAAMVYKNEMSAGSTACRGATPAYNNMLLTKSDGRWNSTVNPSTVLCGGTSIPMNNDGDVVVFEIGLTNVNNPGGAAVVVNCTLTDGLGVAGGTSTVLYAKQQTIQPGQAAYLDWDGNDTGGTRWDDGAHFIYPTVSCTLPPKAQISYTATISQEDNGL
jgi:hypothetical protein